MSKPRLIQDIPYNGPPRKIIRLNAGDVPPGHPKIPESSHADDRHLVDPENPQPGSSHNSFYMEEEDEEYGAAEPGCSARIRNDGVNADENPDVSMETDENGKKFFTT